MAENDYKLRYEKYADVIFPSRKGMERYLRAESELWTPFLDYVSHNVPAPLDVENGHRKITSDQLSIAIESQIQSLDDRVGFNRRTQRYENGIPLPPPSDSLIGQLILGLWHCEMQAEALAAYLYFISQNADVGPNRNHQNKDLFEKGRLLVDTAPVVKALPFSKVSTSKMAGAVRKAENYTQSLLEEVVAAQEKNAKHSEDLAEHLATERKAASRVHDVILRLNRRRSARLKKWQEVIGFEVEEAFKKAEKKSRLVDIAGKRAEENRVKEFERLQALFETQLRLRAPVRLWETREAKHSTNSKSAMRNFMFAGGVAIAFGVGVPFFAGDYIANSFYQQVCNVPATSETLASACERVFSAKGPVTVTGLLLVMSLLMWLARLQYRIHLSERHLSLDASEKKAFAETYLAMKEGKDVSRDNEAIVLASLFRPTQDGIIRDDETGIDFSAAAMFAKQLGRN